MSESEVRNKKKKSIQILKERQGGVSDKLRNLIREQTKTMRALKETIKDSGKTVPEISRLTGISSHEVLWHLMAMKKYGMVIEGEEQDSYHQYTLKEEE